MLCYVMLCYVMLCYVMLCYVTLRYVMLFVIYFAATRKCRPYSISVADRLDSIAETKEVWCQLLCRAVEKFSRQYEHDTLKMQNSFLPTCP
jgi:hypothetical protein